MLAAVAAAAYSPPTRNYQQDPPSGPVFHVSYANELTGWNADTIVYYYEPGTNTWYHRQNGQVIGSVTLNANGTYTATGCAAPPSSGTYATAP